MKITREEFDRSKAEISKIVEPLQFSIHSYSGDLSQITYIDQMGISLDVFIKRKEASLTAIWRVTKIQNGPFSWPHPNFERVFLRQIRTVVSCLPAVGI